jgi:hypothetical protein
MTEIVVGKRALDQALLRTVRQQTLTQPRQKKECSLVLVARMFFTIT